MRSGVTFLEMLVVLVILVVLAALVTPLLSDQVATGQEQVTRTNMLQLRDVILGRYRVENAGRLPRPGAAGLSSGRPDKPQTRYLYYNPQRNPEDQVSTYDPLLGQGWHGPYLLTGLGTYTVDPSRGFTQDFGETGDPCVLDGWNHPILIVETTPHAELRSAGPDGELDLITPDDDIVLTLY